MEQFTNNAFTTLTEALDTSETGVDVYSVTGFPTAGDFRILVDAEIMLVTAIASLTFTVTRGAEGTTVADHANGAAVTHLLTAGALAAAVADYAPRHFSIAAGPEIPDLNTGFTNLLTDTGWFGGGRYCLALNNEVAWDVVLAPGTWELTVWHWKEGNQGIVTVYLDATTLGTYDCYNAGQIKHYGSTFAGISVTTPGTKRLKFKVTSKNASASDYVSLIQGFALRRTA